jgi:phage shock protein PspC (stress-responsive transcriptional regulator)
MCSIRIIWITSIISITMFVLLIVYIFYLFSNNNSNLIDNKEKL